MIINMNGAKAPETPSPTLQEKTVTPETLPTVIGADEGYDGLSQVTVNPDPQLIPTNIRSGKTVFGVTGTFEGVGADDTLFKIMDAGPGRFHEVTVDSTTFGGYTHLKEYGLSYCTVSDIGWDLSSYVPGDYCCSHVVQAVLESGNMVLKGPIKIKKGTSYMFYYSRLINLPEGLEYLFDNMFSYCSFLEDIEIPPGITTVNGFMKVYKIKPNGQGASLTITIPESVTQIASGYQNLSGDGSSFPLNLVMKSTTPPALKGSSSLANINRITVPVGSLEAYQTATNWSAWASVMVEATQ